ncbi:MAG: LysR family transcriptional regulator [Gammaproteobacteria bacterium]|jgi:DNA-binding transcriptional LysR family regulator|nr:LysR family transcriptional regulator [Gammaproteobacteria bacterium]MBU0772240.1 LysR family transcriptional regulator [Gammaproteobacteria bacterium]MBU0855302.1 LysR family transcriptional regulator [Gammaproteobacteria bacterium]MBU1848367.1 LysR family transcriptional regulator [Gammaproteobacteria bacterium]
MHDLNDLLFFARVVEHGGFAPAARALSMHKSKLSRRVALLEERLGVRLIQRSTRRFVVTDIGQSYYTHCVAMLVEADAAQEAVERSRAEPQGIVRLACPSALLDYQVADMLARFMVECPRVQLHLESTNRRVDVIREGFDLAIRVRFPPLEDTDLVMKVLGDSTQRLVAHPRLLAGLGGRAVPADLAQLPSVAWGPPQPAHVWQLEGPDGASAQVHHTPRLVTDGLEALRSAARMGVGVAQLPTMMVRRDLADGSLVEVLPRWAPRSGIAHVVFPSRRGLLPSVRHLVDHLGAGFAALAQAG